MCRPGPKSILSGGQTCSAFRRRRGTWASAATSCGGSASVVESTLSASSATVCRRSGSTSTNMIPRAGLGMRSCTCCSRRRQGRSLAWQRSVSSSPAPSGGRSSVSHLVPNRMTVSIRPDEGGYLGRECPECEHYFKITPGTGLKGEDLPCVCPYCGHHNSHDTFFTQDQIEYAQSVAVNSHRCLPSRPEGAGVQPPTARRLWHRHQHEGGRQPASGSPLPRESARDRAGVRVLHVALRDLRLVRVLPRLRRTQQSPDPRQE